MSIASSCTPTRLDLPSQISSPLKRTSSPFTDPRTPPCSPRTTEQIWDEYERRAKERSKSRETSFSSIHLKALESQRFSSGTVLDIIKSYDPYSSSKALASSPGWSVAPSSPPELGAPPSFTPRKTTLQHTSLSRASCELSTAQTEISVPPSSSGQRSFKSEDALREQGYHIASASSDGRAPATAISPKSPKRSTSGQQRTLPIRLSSLSSAQPRRQSSDRPAVHHKSSASKCSTPGPRIPRKPVPLPTTPIGCTFPQSSPTYNNGNNTPLAPSTPPSTSSSHHHPSNRLASSPEYHLSLYPSTPTTTSTVRSCASTSSPLHRASYSLQNTVSVWEDDDDDEKVGLVDYLRRGWRGSRSSFGFAARRESGSVAGPDPNVTAERETPSESRGRGSWRKWARCGCFGCKDD